MSLWQSIFGSNAASSIEAERRPESNDEQQAVLVRINGSDLGGGVEDVDDLATLEDLLQEALQDEGEVDGHDVGADDATVYCYGRDAEAMFAIMKPVIMSYPLSQRATVTLRFGGPGSPRMRQVALGSAQNT